MTCVVLEFVFVGNISIFVVVVVGGGGNNIFVSSSSGFGCLLV